MFSVTGLNSGTAVAADHRARVWVAGNRGTSQTHMAAGEWVGEERSMGKDEWSEGSWNWRLSVYM